MNATTTSILTAAVAFSGVLVGVIGSGVMGRKLDRQRHQDELLSRAVADFLKGTGVLAGLSQSPDMGSVKWLEERRQAFGAVADAKARLAIYGAPDLVLHLAAFDRAGADLARTECGDALLELVIAARSVRSHRAQLPSKSDLSVILFGRDVTDQ